jgi:hypothetical protein
LPVLGLRLIGQPVCFYDAFFKKRAFFLVAAAVRQGFSIAWGFNPRVVKKPLSASFYIDNFRNAEHRVFLTSIE